MLTRNIQNVILEAIKCNYVPQDLGKQLSKYTSECLDRKKPDEKEKSVAIPFKLVKQLWECVREKKTG